MSAAPAEAAASTTKAVVARKSFFIANPLSDVRVGFDKPLLTTLPRQQLEPARRRSDDAGWVLVVTVVRRLRISCDPFATVAGKSAPQRDQGRFFRGHAGYAAATARYFTAASTRPGCCPNAPAMARP